jgi:hypothetical protein
VKNIRNAIISALSGIGLGWVINNLSDSYVFPPWLAWSLAIVFLAGGIIPIVRLRERIQAKPTPYQVPKGQDAASVHKSKKGLIVTVSLPYPPIDWNADIPINSNLYTLLTAIKAHGSSLEYIWLLGTADPKEGKGSGSIFKDVKDYINRNRESLGLTKEPKIEFLNTIPMDFDNQVTECVRKTVDEVFDHADDFGLKQSDIIADCTGGTKSMTLGVILACLEEDRDIQLIGSQYKSDGRPDGSSAFPMIFEYSTSRAEYNK